jgi:hypothetical protein
VKLRGAHQGWYLGDDVKLRGAHQGVWRRADVNRVPGRYTQ